MHTVRFAHAQGRKVACIDHPQRWLAEDKTKGNQRPHQRRQGNPDSGRGGAKPFFLDGLQWVAGGVCGIDPGSGRSEAAPALLALVIFDFDLTLVDTGPVEKLRAMGQWRGVMERIPPA